MLKTTKAQNIIRNFTPAEIVAIDKALSGGILDHYKPKHIKLAASMIEDVTDNKLPYTLTITEASKAWGIPISVIKELINEGKLHPILLGNSKKRFKFGDIDEVIEDCRM